MNKTIGFRISVKYVLILMTVVLLTFTGCQQRKVESSIVGAWASANGEILNFYEDGHVTISDDPSDWMYEFAKGGKYLLVYNDLYSVKLGVEQMNDSLMVLENDTVMLVYVKANESNNGSGAFLDGKTALDLKHKSVPGATISSLVYASIPDVSDIPSGEVGRLGSDMVYVLGWYWVDEECVLYDNPTPETKLAAELLIRHMGEEPSISLEDYSFRDSTGLSYEAKESTSINGKSGYSSCAPLIENKLQSYNNVFTGIPRTSRYYIVSDQDGDEWNWSEWRDFTLFAKVDHEEKEKEDNPVIYLRLSDKPGPLSLPQALDPLSTILLPLDGKGSKMDVMLDSVSVDTTEDFEVNYSVKFSITNTSEKSLNYETRFLAIDRYGSYHEGKIAQSEMVTPGETLKVDGSLTIPDIPDLGKVVLVVFEKGQTDFSLIELPVQSDDSSQEEVEVFDKEGYVIPYKACEDAIDSRIVTGITAMVSPGGQSNRIRSATGFDAGILGLVDPGTKFTILGGPECKNGLTWWNIELLSAPAYAGWMAEGDGDYWIEPLP